MVFQLFSKRMQEIIKQKGFDEPTLPQKLGIPDILSGRNCLIIAPTGTGKTEVSCLPLFDKIYQNSQKNKINESQSDSSKPISMLYINPLRSLSRDLLDRLVWWANKLDLDISVRHGDVSAKDKAIQRECPPHILILTPETLNAILVGKKMREHLRNVKYVVIDEIHELASSKRGTQLSLLLERLKNIAGDFQRIGLSATIGNFEDVANFLGGNIDERSEYKDTKTQTDSSKVRIIHADLNKQYSIKVQCAKPTKQDVQEADNLLIGPDTYARLKIIHSHLKSNEAVLVFSNTRETAEVLSSRLRSIDKELMQTVHHGSLSKEKRINSEHAFKKQQLKSLIATSSLELGIDIGSVDFVIQYLSPRQVSRLIQRIGRGGHRINRVSKGIILSGDEDLFESAVIANLAMKKQPEKIKIHEQATDVLATQIIGMIMEEYDLTDDFIYNTIKRAYPFRNLSKDAFMEVLRFLESLRLIWMNPYDKKTATAVFTNDKTTDLQSKSSKNNVNIGYKIKRSRRAIEYYFENLSMIPDTQQYKVISIVQGEPIGNLDEAFIAEHGKPGEKFICSGRAWKVIQVDGKKVMVEPVEDIESAIPAWEGEMIPVPFDIAQGVGKLRAAISKDPNKAAEEFNINKPELEEMNDIIEKQKKCNTTDREQSDRSAKGTIPDDKTLLIEDHKDFIIIHSCFGSLVNDTIGRYVAAILTAETGSAVNMKSDPYRIMIQTTASKEKIKNILTEAKNLEEIISISLEYSQMFKYRFIHIAKRFGIISKRAEFDKVSINKIISQYHDSHAYKETLREIMHEKLNIEHANHMLEQLKQNKIKIMIENSTSYLGELGLQHKFAEIIKPSLPEEEIYKAFKKRLLATRMRLLCSNCGEYNITKEVREMDKQPECPSCGSRMIACLHRSQIDAANIIKKYKKKKQLAKEEEKRFKEIRRNSDIVMVYGKRACVALAGHGIGTETAARILAKRHDSKRKFLKDVLQAEKDFARTRIYWK